MVPVACHTKIFFILIKMKAIVPEFKSRHSKYEVLDKALESASTDA